MKRFLVFADNFGGLGSAMQSFRGSCDTFEESLAMAKQWFLDDHRKNSPADLPTAYAFDGGYVCIWDSELQIDIVDTIATKLFTNKKAAT